MCRNDGKRPLLFKAIGHRFGLTRLILNFLSLTSFHFTSCISMNEK